MATTRYGRIWHGNHLHNNIKFLSADERNKFAEAFDTYHTSHDHEGEAPRFEEIKASDLRSYEKRPNTASEVTLDGYAAYEIEKYHHRTYADTYTHYSVPTCCVSPIIVLDDREFIDSATLERHELSAIFGDMPDTDFDNLLKSIEKEGFIDPLILTFEGKVLDGWHRYRAALQLNLVRRLRFMPWSAANKEGDPYAYVLARNIERRHLSASQRAQIVVSFNERFNRGNIEAQRSVGHYENDSGTPNGEPKTREELAKKAGVGTSTIDRAVAVEKAGESEKVIAGEKSASEVLKEREAQKLLKQKKQAAKLLWDTRIQAAQDYVGDGDSDLNMHLTLHELEEGFANNNPTYTLDFRVAMTRTSEQSFKIMWDKIVETDVDLNVLQHQVRALQAYASDILQWQRPDWSPDTNWILPLIVEKRAQKRAEASEETAPDPEPDKKTLREQVKARISKYKEWYKESGYKEYELIAHASFSHFIQAYRSYRASEAEGTATAEELKDLLDILKRKSYPFARRLRDYLRGAPSTAETETEETSSELPLENTMNEMESIQKFDARLKEFGACEDLLCDTLHFYYGIERADLDETPQETLVKISEFIEGFIDKPVEEWPEYIRNQVPKRELMLVSIGISRDDDVFELVEFSDETSDEIDCELDELPQELRDALFKLALKKIVESEEA